MTRQYPLEALRKLREERAEQQALAVAAQAARVQAAELALRRAEQGRREHARSVAETERAEAERLAWGQLSGADLLRSLDYRAAMLARAEHLARAESEAQKLLAAERGKELELREQLSRRDADVKLVQSHESKFHEQQASALLHAEEEAALEQWNARRH